MGGWILPLVMGALAQAAAAEDKRETYPGRCEKIVKKGTRTNWEFGYPMGPKWERLPESSACQLELLHCEVHAEKGTKRITLVALILKNISATPANGYFQTALPLPVPERGGKLVEGDGHYSFWSGFNDFYSLAPGEQKTFQFPGAHQIQSRGIEGCPGSRYISLREFGDVAHEHNEILRRMRTDGRGLAHCPLGATETTHFRLCDIVWR